MKRFPFPAEICNQELECYARGSGGRQTGRQES